MKKSELFFSFLLIPIDIIAILCSITIAYFIRTRADIPMPVAYILPFHDYIKLGLASLPIWLIVFTFTGLYNLNNTRRGYKEFVRVLAACPIVMMIGITVIFFMRINVYSRIIFVYIFVLSVILITLARVFVRISQRFLFRFGIGIKKVIIIGKDKIACDLIKEFGRRKSLGCRVLGIVNGKENEIKGIAVLGTIEEIEILIDNYHPDEIIQTDPDLDTNQMLELISLCENKGVVFKFVPNLLSFHTINVDIQTIAQVPLIELKRTPLDGWARILKRSIDIIGSIVAIVIFSPLMIIIAILIKSTSKGPVIFTQERVGRDGNFRFYKFRTMYDTKDAEARHAAYLKKYGNMFKLKDDPRVTPIGRFLRKTSLDELPQFFNVFLGNMSLVGPRPPMPIEVEQYDRFQRKRLGGVKPGITGLWQVSGRSDVLFDEWVKLDVYYIENWSIWLDLVIILKTIKILFTGKGAY